MESNLLGPFESQQTLEYCLSLALCLGTSRQMPSKAMGLRALVHCWGLRILHLLLIGGNLTQLGLVRGGESD